MDLGCALCLICGESFADCESALVIYCIKCLLFDFVIDKPYQVVKRKLLHELKKNYSSVLKSLQSTNRPQNIKFITQDDIINFDINLSGEKHHYLNDFNLTVNMEDLIIDLDNMLKEEDVRTINNMIQEEDILMIEYSPTVEMSITEIPIIKIPERETPNQVEIIEDKKTIYKKGKDWPKHLRDRKDIINYFPTYNLYCQNGSHKISDTDNKE